MKKIYFVSMALFLFIALSGVSYAALCTDLGYSVDGTTDAVCTDEYNACLPNQVNYECSEYLETCCDSAGGVVDQPIGDPIGDGVEYVNPDYGFTLYLPYTWSEYEVLMDDYGTVIYYTFYLPSTEVISFSMFSIGVSAAEVSEYEEYLGTDGLFYYTFSHPNGDYPSDLQPLIADFDGIKATFGFTDGVYEEIGFFSDTNGHPYEQAIGYVKDAGIVSGYGDGTYKPDNPINRAEFTKILMESQIDASYFGGTYCFNDVAADWFAQYVCAAKDLGIINGYPDGSFAPGGSINLAESLKILLETAAAIEGLEILDVPGPWYQKYIDLANAVGLLNTINSDPAHILTRGEMAEMIFIAETS